MSDFYSKINNTASNVSITENGAVGYKTTMHAMLDFNFKISSYRGKLSTAINDFKKILDEDEAYALKFLFYVRDAREGVGERDLFRSCLETFVNYSRANVDTLVDVIIKQTPQFGRWDDLFVLLNTKYKDKVISDIKSQLFSDFENLKAGKSISLLAKWMPSENASSVETKSLARVFIKEFGCTPKQYRTMLTALREKLKVVERDMCSKNWDGIDYNAVPSKANIKYGSAFLRNDETRRREWLSKLASGDKSVHINSSVNFPHDVLHMYATTRGWSFDVKDYDETVEQLWKNLKGCDGLKDTIVVRDDSGSMTSTVSGTNIMAYEIATALGIYCAQHNNDAYKNKIITFSETPRYLDFSDEHKFGSLNSIYKFLVKHSEVANTNVKAVFDLILKTAIENKCTADEMPKQILILSDMEFDHCGGNYINQSLMSKVSDDYTVHGYKLPRLIFWNLCSRTGTIPMKQNDNGVVLVSGFSQNILKLVQSGKTDPYEVLVDGLNVERYNSIPLVEYTNTPVVKSKSTRKREAVQLETPNFLK